MKIRHDSSDNVDLWRGAFFGQTPHFAVAHLREPRYTIVQAFGREFRYGRTPTGRRFLRTRRLP